MSHNYLSNVTKPFYLDDSLDSNPELTQANYGGSIRGKIESGIMKETSIQGNVPFYLINTGSGRTMRTIGHNDMAKENSLYYDDLVYPLNTASANYNNYDGKSNISVYPSNIKTQERHYNEGFWNESYTDPLAKVRAQGIDTTELLNNFKKEISDFEISKATEIGKRQKFIPRKEEAEEKFWEFFGKSLKTQNSCPLNPKQDALKISESEHIYLGEVLTCAFQSPEETAIYVSQISPKSELEDFEKRKCYFSSELQCLLFLDSTQFQLQFRIKELKQCLLAVFDGLEDTFLLILWKNPSDVLVISTPKLSFFDFIEEKFGELGREIKIVSSSDILSTHLSDMEKRIQTDFSISENFVSNHSLKEPITPPLESISHRSHENQIKASELEFRLDPPIHPIIEITKASPRPGSERNIDKGISSVAMPVINNAPTNIKKESSSSEISDTSSEKEKKPIFYEDSLVKSNSEIQEKSPNPTYRAPIPNINFNQPSSRVSERFPEIKKPKVSAQLESTGILLASNRMAIDPDKFDPIAYRDEMRKIRENEARELKAKEDEAHRLRIQEEEAHRLRLQEEESQRIKEREAEAQLLKKKEEEAHRLRLQEEEAHRLRFQEEEELRHLQEAARKFEEESLRRHQEEYDRELSLRKKDEIPLPILESDYNSFGNHENPNNSMNFGGQSLPIQPTQEQKLEEALRTSMIEDGIRKEKEEKARAIAEKKRIQEEADRERDRIIKMRRQFADAVRFLSSPHEFLKYGYKNFRSPNKRFLHFSDDMINFFWNSSATKKVAKSNKTYSTTDILDILDGRSSANFKRFKPKTKNSLILSFSLIVKGRSIDLEAKDVVMKNSFMEAVKTVSHVLKDEELYERIILTGT